MSLNKVCVGFVFSFALNGLCILFADGVSITRTVTVIHDIDAVNVGRTEIDSLAHQIIIIDFLENQTEEWLKLLAEYSIAMLCLCVV